MALQIPLYRLRFYIYTVFLLWAVLLLSLSAARLAYTEHLPKGDPLHGGVDFYDPSVVALLVSAILGVLFALFMLYTLEKRFTHNYFTTLAFEITALVLLWVLWLVSTAAATKVWPDLSFCVQYRACTNLQAMVAFAWLGWAALSLVLGITAFAAVSHAVWREHAHGEWADGPLVWAWPPRSWARGEEGEEVEVEVEVGSPDMRSMRTSDVRSASGV